MKRSLSIALFAVVIGGPGCGKVDPTLMGGQAEEVAPANPLVTPPPAAEVTAPVDNDAAPAKEDGAARPDLAAGVTKVAAKARLAERREVVVDCVWVRGQGDSAEGGTSPVTVRIEPNTKGEASVGVIEEYAGGAGDMWRASAWMAAFNASEQLGYMLTDHEFLVRSGGYIDGPSAGMLTTAAMLAILTDTPVLENSTMSGTINPDGSAGPVGGLVQKMHGAKAKGKTRFGYPVGTRNTLDYRTNTMADLDVVGRELGLEVVEINDVREAYEFMTGKELAPLVLASESDMAIDSDLRTRVKAKLMSWQADLNGRTPGLDKRVETMRQEIKSYAVPILQQLNSQVVEANNFEKSGLEVAAYNRMVVSAMLFRMTMETVDVLEAMYKGDFAKVEERIVALSQVQTKADALGLELGINARKKTLGGLVNSVASYSMYALSYSLVNLGKGHYQRAHEIIDLINAKKIPQTEAALNQMVSDLLKPVGYFAAAEAVLQAAREQMDFAPEEGADITIDPTKFARLAKAFGSAAAAGIAYFDSTVVKSAAESSNVSLQQAKDYFVQADGNYLIAPMLADLAAAADRVVGDKPEAALLRLSAGAAAFIQSGGLINKYYSLGFTRNADGTAVLKERRALSSQLELAKRSALAAAGEAKKLVGFIPATARLSFEDASALREGDDEDKLEALTGYWQSAFWSRLVVTLARP